MRIDKFILKIVRYGLESIGLFYSSYRGLVVDTDDPKHLGRIKIQVPEIYGEKTLETWVSPKGMYAGISAGFHLLPEKGDLVWITFQKGNKRFPLWEFGYRGSSDYTRPNNSTSRDIWLKTKNGILLSISDVKDAPHVRIELPNGAVFDMLELIELKVGSSSTEGAILGETLKSKLEEFYSKVTQFRGIVNPATLICTPDPTWIVEVEVLKAQLSTIISKNFKHN